jgi:hypothetical protein
MVTPFILNTDKYIHTNIHTYKDIHIYKQTNKHTRYIKK